MSATADLNARVTQLEQLVQQLQLAGGMDTLTPNYVTVAADGSIGADFSGRIQAQGVVLPQAANTTPAADDSIEWTTDGSFDETPASLIWGQRQTPGNVAFNALNIQANTNSNQPTVTAKINAIATKPTAAQERLVIDSNGNSDFLQAAGNLQDLINTQTARANLGVARFWPMGQAVLPAIAANSAVAVTFSNAGWNLAYPNYMATVMFQSIPYSWEYLSNTATSFTISVWNFTGVNQGAGGNAFLSMLTYP